jgi:hypothetical protein
VSLLLDYRAATLPDPLQASPATGDLVAYQVTVLAANPSAAPAAIAGLQITLPVGTAGSDLTETAPDVKDVTAPEGFTAQVGSNPGAYEFVPAPNSPVEVGADGLVFVFNEVYANRQPGPVVNLTVMEGSGGCSPPDCPTTQVPLMKLPDGWGHPVELIVTPPALAAGEGVFVQWSGGPASASYALEYATPAAVVEVPGPLGPDGRWPADGAQLALSQTAVFTLTVQETVDGTAYSAQYQQTVAVKQAPPAIARFSGVLVQNGADYEVLLDWVAANTRYCELNAVPGMELTPESPAGGYPLPANPPWNATYELTATGDIEPPASSTLTLGWAVQRVISGFDAGASTGGLAVAPDGSRLCVVAGSTLTILQGATTGGPLDQPSTSQPLPAQAVFQSIAVDPLNADPEHLWATWGGAQEGAGSIGVLLVPPSGGPFVLGQAAVSTPLPLALAVSPGHSSVYLVENGQLHVYEGTAFQVEEIASLVAVTAIAAAPDGTVYAATPGDVTALKPVDVKGMPFVTLGTVPLPGPASASALAVAGDFLFVALATGVLVVDRTRFQPLGDPIPVQADALAASPDGLTVYTLSLADGTVSVVSPIPLTGGVS